MTTTHKIDEYLNRKVDGNKVSETATKITSDYNDMISNKFEDECELGKKLKIIKDDEIKIKFDYPLSGTFIFTEKCRGGWTREKLFKRIQAIYIQIYKEESKTNKKGSTDYIPGMLNRDYSDGKYGIWGHHITDLVLESIEYDKKTKVVTLSVGS